MGDVKQGMKNMSLLSCHINGIGTPRRFLRNSYRRMTEMTELLRIYLMMR